jgi:ParB/RepB/Spo0J family partition protein
MKGNEMRDKDKPEETSQVQQKPEPKSKLFSSPKAQAALRGQLKPKAQNRAGATKSEQTDQINLLLIPIAAIDPNPFYNLKAKSLETADSRNWLLEKLTRLFQEGQLTEFVALVRPHPTEPQRYQLAYGHLRLEAARLAGKSVVPAVVSPLSDDEMLMRLVLENQNRANPSRVETAAQVRHLREQFGWSFKALGELFNLPLATVYDLYYLSEAPPKFLKLVEAQPQYYQAISEMLRRKLSEEGQHQVWEFLQTNQPTPRQLREKIKELLLVNQK